MNVSVRLGEIAQTILSRWPIPPQPAKPIANFCYLTVSDRSALADVAGKSVLACTARGIRCQRLLLSRTAVGRRMSLQRFLPGGLRQSQS